MKLMNAALFGSTGALLMSVFHQFEGGKSGNGGGSGPPAIWAQVRSETIPTIGSIWLFSFTICRPQQQSSGGTHEGRSSRTGRHLDTGVVGRDSGSEA